MANIKLIVAYKGTHYLGWQKTRCGPSIEEALEKALSQLLREEVSLQAASRTDAGVHAHGQVVNFFLKDETKDLSLLKKGMNALLPKDISVLSLSQVPDSFHPTLDCHGKEYNYCICYGASQLPFFRRHSWHFPCEPNFEDMRSAKEALIGRHDFSAFCNERSLYLKDATREIFHIEITPLPYYRLKISLIGNHFLYKMARNIAGTLAYIGAGKLSPHDIPSILQSKDRKKAGMTAPAHGLTLKEVFYSPFPQMTAALGEKS